jgi:hypothetical protein
MKYGYGRVSTDELKPDILLKAVKRAECDKVLRD